MPKITPGQVNYEAFCAFWAAHGLSEQALFAWSALTPEMQAAWDAAAQAVLQPRVAGQAAQLHQLIDALVAHAAPVLLDKVHLWLSDVTASAEAPCTRRQEGDEGA